jgi:hypothetical protein
MDIFTVADLNQLVNERPGPCVSIYCPVLPGCERDAVHWKNLVRTARRRLDGVGVNGLNADALLGPAAALVDQAEVWQAAGSGLACYVAPGFCRHYRLRLTWPERVIVGRVFDVRPVLPWLAVGRFFVLGLSQNGVRLIRGTADGQARVPLGGPTNSCEALWAHDSDEMSFAHTFVGGSGSRRKAAFHGHGVGVDDAKDELLVYFRAIDRALHPILRDERDPLVVATVDYLLPLFRKACHYPHLFDTGIPGNPDRWSDRRLADKARELLAPRIGAAAQDALATYRRLDGTGRTMHDLGEIVSAAHRGEVDSVYIAAGRDVWGRFDPDTGGALVYLDRASGDEELTGLAAAFAVRHGRRVHLLPPEKLPGGAAVVAICPLPLPKHGKAG